MKNKFFLSCLFILILFITACSGDITQGLSKNIDILTAKLESLYKKSIAEHPGKEEYKIKLAEFYYRQREYLKAKDVLSNLSSKEAKLLLAKSYAKLKDYTQALDIFDRINNLFDPEGLYLYGLSLEKKNMFPQAKKIYLKIKSGPYLKLAREEMDSFSLKFSDKVPLYLSKIIDNSPTVKDFPNASSVILLCEESMEITPDNRSVSVIHMVAKVLNDKGRNDWGEVEIGYDSTYERVELDFARTITPDKKMVYAGKENIRDVSKYLNFPLYSNSRAFIVSMPQVLKGSIIEYKVKIYQSKLMNEKDFSLIYRLKSPHPIMKETYCLSVPKGRKVYFSTVNKKYAPQGVDFRPQKTEKGKNTEYFFSFKNVPQLLPESSMLPSSFVNPAIIISSFKEWKDFYLWWKSLYKDKLSLSPELKRFLNTLINPSDSDYLKAKKIYEFCAEKIRYVAIEYGKAGFEPHQPKDVFINKYGDCKDQAILLVSLLRGAGLKAYPVLVPTRKAYNLVETRPASYFNHAIAAVSLEGKLIFMDPTAFTTSFGDIPLGDQKRKTLIFLDDRYRIAETPELKDNHLEVKMKIKINPLEEADVYREVITEGFFAASQRYYLRFTPPQLIRDDVQTKMKSFASLSNLKWVKTEGVEGFDSRPVLRYDFLARNLLSRSGNIRLLPVLGEPLVNTSWVDKEKRQYPLDLNGCYLSESDIAITLPENLEVKSLPEDLEIGSRWVDFKLNYSLEDKKILFHQEMAVKTDRVNEKDYPEFKKIIERILSSRKQQAILEETNEKKK